jgi:hypothetical protein
MSNQLDNNGWTTNQANIFGWKIPLNGPPWFQNTIVIILLGLTIWSLVWISKDAKKRGKSSFGAVFFAISAAYPISLLWWLWLRPALLSRRSPSAPPVLPRQNT